MEEILLTIRSQTLERIREITAQPKPSYRIEDQQIEWSDYLQTLQKTLQWVNEQLAIETPTEIITRGEVI